jgi:hypothetical protein
LIRQADNVIPQRFLVSELRESSAFDIIDSHVNCLAQHFKPHRIFLCPLFQKAQARSQDLAGILVLARSDKMFHEVRLVLGQNNISGWHVSSCAAIGIICHVLGRFVN